MTLEDLCKKKVAPGMIVVSDVDGVHTRPGGGVKISARPSSEFGTLFTLRGDTEVLDFAPTDENIKNRELCVGGYENENIMEFYEFHTPDGQAVSDLLRRKAKLIIVSGRDAAPVRDRFENKLGAETHLGVSDKLDHFTNIGLDFGKLIVIADGHQDVPLLNAVRLAGGISIAPADAEDEAKGAAECLTKAKGGEGAFAELANAYLSCLK